MNVFREDTDLPEGAQQESGRIEFKLWPPDSTDTVDEAWSRLPLLTDFLQLTPSGLPCPRQLIPEPHATH